MAKDKNTYAKRQRETIKRQKAEEKQERRRQRKASPGGANGGEMSDDPSLAPESEPADAERSI